jgi:triosephosphate isomerase
MGTRRPVVAGNWKMNGSLAFIGEFVERFGRVELPANVTVVLFPPAAYLERLRRDLDGTAVEFGAQNAHTESDGAFTGEVAPEMIRDLGARWLLVGHSERREYFGEADDVVADKFAAALRAGLIPILCVGESLEQRREDQADAVVRQQLTAVASRVGVRAFTQGAVAYEPVWAIGTGQTATPDQAQAMHGVIRQQLSALDETAAAEMQILYGGSMGVDNAAALLSQPDVDGGLVGGASLRADVFAAIVATAGAAAG